ncbi:extracellular catalytic domain type 1 short-chain-length polyhydroxyalkanoate depolymerase [Brevundimonas subvibrioides]|uniref:Esterase, PHB depolymerase family n=1 Tax=Brevundimonas subvibrioides (strain ATCC 15264 / DSM 4735 / LMG 14903 / NBRC 16000 / CB 81) TaxID=633149 RepID=D9QNG4_BRESC|nr:esterase, PHB depolymerase family [Brevundimonas subvibrioides ATCC 15264]
MRHPSHRPGSSVGPSGNGSRPAGRRALLTDEVGFAPNPGDLRMKLFLPETLPAGAPLVVVLHGCTQTAVGYAHGAGWLALAAELGFAVLCPEQTRANNANLCFNWFQPGDTTRDAGEAASIHAMVQWALRKHDLDRRRVFVTGLSAGGAMTAVMLATYPETFAAGAVIAGLAYGSAHSMPEAFAAMTQAPARPDRNWGDSVRGASDHAGGWPRLSIWHGTHDATVRPAAGEALLRQWIDVHGLMDAPIRMRAPDGRFYEVWRGPDGQPVIEMHRIRDMGHGTPLKPNGEGGNGTAGPFLLDVGIASSREIVRHWGIGSPATDTMPEPGSVVAERGPISREPARGRPKAPATSDTVTAVIENALRSAGLLR